MVQIAQEVAAVVLIAWLLIQALSILMVAIQAARTELARKITALYHTSNQVAFALGYRFGRLVKRLI